MTPHQIKALRKQRGWTQQKLAETIGVAVSSIARWESPAGRPPKGASLRSLETLVQENSTRPNEDVLSGPAKARGDIAADGTLRQAVVTIMGDMDCGKDFKCADAGFQDLCRARDIGLDAHLECLEEGAANCQFATKFDEGQLCNCPLRVYLYRTMSK